MSDHYFKLYKRKLKVLHGACAYIHYQQLFCPLFASPPSSYVSLYLWSFFLSLSESLSLTLLPDSLYYMQISPTATSIILSDKRLFPTFLRTIPSDNASIATITAVVREYAWQQVAIITERSPLYSNVCHRTIVMYTRLVMTLPIIVV